MRTKVPREINISFEKDRAQFKKDMTKARKKHTEEYWNIQTQVENQAFEKFR